MRKYLFELFDEIREADGNRTTIRDLIANGKSKSLKMYLAGAYNPNVKPVFTEDTIPDYKPDDSPLGMSYTTLMGETRRLLYFFTPGKPCKLEALQRMYINICEGLHPKEAELFTDIILKRLFIEGLNYEVINAGFGEKFLPPPVEEEKKENVS